ncbi:MAG: helix-turn-helix domain-containing protein [Lachnospiraceae bacterium]
MLKISKLSELFTQKTQKNFIGCFTSDKVICHAAIYSEETLSDSGLHSSTLYIAAYDPELDHIYPNSFLFVNTSVPPEKNSENLYIQEDLPLSHCLSVCEEILDDYFTLCQAKDSLYQIAKSTTSIDEILNTAYQHLKNPITFCDASFELVASSENAELTKDSFEFINGHYIFKTSSLLNFYSEEIDQKLLKSSNAFYLFSEKRNRAYIFCSIFMERTCCYFLCVHLLNKSSSAFDLDYVKYLSYVLGESLHRITLFSQTAYHRHGFVMRTLLNTAWDTDEAAFDYLAQLSNIPRNFSGSYAFLLIQPTIFPSHAMAVAHLQQLRTFFPDSAAAYFHNFYTVLLTKSFSASQTLRLFAFLEITDSIAALSPDFSSLKSCRLYFDCAEIMIQSSENIRNETRLLDCTKYPLNILLNQFPREDLLPAFIHPAVHFLKNYDQKNHAELFHTLDMYLRNRCNQLKTANAMYLHKSTISYRISRIQDLTSLNLENNDEIFLCMLSYKILEFLEYK